MYLRIMQYKRYIINNISSEKIYRIIHWADEKYPVVCVLNSNIDLINSVKRKIDKKDLDIIIAAGSKVELLPSGNGNFKKLKKFYQKNSSIRLRSSGGTWIFGFLNYDLKNEVENLSSAKPDHIGMPLMHFFIPEHLFIVKNNSIKILSNRKCIDLEKEILKPEVRSQKSDLHSKTWRLKNYGENRTKIKLKLRISKKDYIEKVNKIKKCIQRGDIYELNFCQEFFAENTVIHPLETWFRLNEISPMPFSCYYKLRDKYLLCSSPERFLKKEGKKIFSQPIKGTIRRGKNAAEDQKLKSFLIRSRKEQSENIMIVDLVRNDLSKIAENGSVAVQELCGLHTYQNLHHMISTISCDLSKERTFTDALQSCFPMGSMTGAPKIKAMELIEKYERTKRGLFSGALGYITPEGDFDFNVVIRSILYNSKSRYVSLMAGSAITASSDAKKEYSECLLKIKPMMEALNARF